MLKSKAHSTEYSHHDFRCSYIFTLTPVLPGASETQWSQTTCLILWKWNEMKWKVLSHVWLCRPCGLSPARLLCPWNSPGKSTRVGCHALFQGIFPTQESNLCLLHCRWILYRLSHQEWKVNWLWNSTKALFYFYEPRLKNLKLKKRGNKKGLRERV